MDDLTGCARLSAGRARTKVKLFAVSIGSDIFVCIHNENAHIGAIAVGEYSSFEERVSVSLITRLGHKDDIIAQKAAYNISKKTKKTSCVIAGIHLDEVKKVEISTIIKNSNKLVSKYISLIYCKGI